MRTTSPLVINKKGYSSKNREGIPLSGTYNGVNRAFTLPEPAVIDPPKTILKLYHNGRRMHQSEFQAYESVPGDGYDLITIIAFAPQSTAVLVADFIRF